MKNKVGQRSKKERGRELEKTRRMEVVGGERRKREGEIKREEEDRGGSGTRKKEEKGPFWDSCSTFLSELQMIFTIKSGAMSKGLKP